jgi:uncharacterized protein (DUF362 family)
MKYSKVSIAYSDSAPDSVTRCLDTLDEMPVLLKNKHVAIKPNDTWASPDDLSPCTQADTVRAVIRYVKRFGPKKITVSGGAGAAETDNVFHYLGIDRVIEEEGVEFFDHNRPPFRRVRLKHGPQKEVMINPYVLAYETLISLAQHKVHHSARVTMTMKNIALSYPAADYYGHPRTAMLHPHHFFKDLEGFIAAMAERFPPALGIIAGHPVMVGEGPIGGDTFESGLTIASRDVVAADYVGALLLGVEDVRHIRLAGEYGLGAASLDAVAFPGIGIEEAQKLFRQKADEAGVPLRELARR